MIRKLLFLVFLFILSCTNNKSVYWCGDHPCINKKEKESYFKKTMIVEVKNLKNIKNKSSEIEKITEQAKQEEKKRIKKEKSFLKQAKLDEKKRIKRERDLAKKAKLEEKKRIKEEKKLEKQIKLDEKRMKKKMKKNKKKVIEKVADTNVKRETAEIKLNKFEELVEKITGRNSVRSYPDINNIPD